MYKLIADNYILKKEVDWSMFQHGITLPRNLIKAFGMTATGIINRGEKKEISLILNGETYDVIVKNCNNSLSARKNDILQIRYSKGSKIAVALRNYFKKSYDYILDERKKRKQYGKRNFVKLPDELKEYLVFYTTNKRDVFVVEPVYANDKELGSTGVNTSYNRKVRRGNEMSSFDAYSDELQWNEYRNFVREANNSSWLDEFLDGNWVDEELSIIQREMYKNKRFSFSAIDELIGIIDSINYDGIINFLEVDRIKKWLDDNESLLLNHRYTSFLKKLKTIVSDNIIDDDEKKYLVEQSYLFKRDMDEIDGGLSALKGILEGIVCDNVVADKEIYCLNEWLQDNKHLEGIKLFDNISNAVGNVLEDNVISEGEKSFLLSLISKLLDEPVVIKYEYEDSKCSTLQDAVVNVLSENDGLLSKEIVAQIPNAEKIEVNKLLHSINNKDIFVQDDDYKWHYRSEYEDMGEEELSVLRSILTNELHDGKMVKQQFYKLVDNANVDKINNKNLRKVGYQISGKIIYRSKHQSLSEYLEWLMQRDDIINLSELDSLFVNLGANRLIKRLRDNYTIVEFSPRKYININKLESAGITKNDLVDYGEHACEFANGQFFNLKSLKKHGFNHKVDELGFDNFFYQSLLIANSKCVQFEVCGKYVFIEAKASRGLPELIEYIISQNGCMDIYDLKDKMYEEYGIDIGKLKLENNLKSANVFYSDTMEKVYLDYEQFFEEV